MAETEKIPRGSRPRGTRTDSGKARHEPMKLGRPKKPGPKPKGRNKKTDITLPPAFIDAIDKVSRRDRIPKFEWHRLAVFAYAKELAQNPIEPEPTRCETCLRPYKAHRRSGDLKRLRATVNFDDDTIALMDWIADNFYNGTWSQAFEASCRFFLGKDAPPTKLQQQMAEADQDAEAEEA